MSVKRTIIAAAAALAVVTGAGAAGTLTANAATEACGARCTDIFSAQYGTTAHPNYLLAAANESGPVGTPITLNIAGTLNPAEDFEVLDEGTIEEFYRDGFVPAGLAALYGNLEGLEIVYAPDGTLTDNCVGVAFGPGPGTLVSLQPCGVTVKTLWIAYQRSTTAGVYFELINAATTSDFTDPYVLTAITPGLPLVTARLTRFARFLRFQLWGSIRPFALS